MTHSPRVTYVVLAHSRERQLLRLVRILREESPTSSVVIHWDSEAPPLDPTPFRELGNVFFVDDRVHPEWGGFGLVEALLRAMRVALRRTRFDWLVVLSGQDYPILPLERSESELAGADGDAWIDPGRLASGRLSFRWRRDAGTRLGRRYYFAHAPLPRIRLRLPRRVRGALLRGAFLLDAHQPFASLWPMPRGVRWRLGVRRPRTPFGPDRPCRVGSSWFSLSRRGVEHVLEQAADRGRLVRHYRRTISADESFFQTIVCADPELAVVPENGRFEIWEDSDSPLHPETLTVARLDEILSCGRHFARKFDEQLDGEVLDRIDDHRRRLGAVDRERSGARAPEPSAFPSS